MHHISQSFCILTLRCIGVSAVTILVRRPAGIGCSYLITWIVRLSSGRNCIITQICRQTKDWKSFMSSGAMSKETKVGMAVMMVSAEA